MDLSTRKGIHLLSAGTMVFLTVLALGILLLSGRSLADAFDSRMAWPLQLALGVAVGMAAGAILSLAEYALPGLEKLREIVKDVFRRYQPTHIDLLVVSAGAGWGEELLFRGALQPLIGVWPAAVAFALAHFMLTRITLGRVLYTLGLVLAGAGLGYLADWAGLAAAMLAHGVYDYVALAWAREDLRRRGKL